jgi:hypothetical protein
MPLPSREPNIFTTAQDADLGDAMAERFEGYLRTIDDAPLVEHLTRIGNRLAAHLPPNDFKFQFRLIDIPDANAFVLPGGRVYVSRKLIGLTRSEDELAGVIGHELGHLAARHHTVAISRQLREVLNITSVADRQDILTKYNRLMENAGRKPGVFRSGSHDDAEQVEADRIGLFIVAASGYDAKAVAPFFDRFLGTEGDTGGFFSRLFGTTNPDARRLGELLRTQAALPAGCAPESAPSPEAYRKWQLAVATANVAGQNEMLPGLIRQLTLAPFRDEIQHIRVSPDGRFLLAQNSSSIFVLDRSPLALRFRIDRQNMRPAEFTPDSASVLLHTPDLRIERWSVADKTLVDVDDMYLRTGCPFSTVSPDGRTVACVDVEGHLTLRDVRSGRLLVQHKSFYVMSYGDLLLRLFQAMSNLRYSGLLTLQFSTSGQYFAAGYTSYLGASAFAYDVTKERVINVKEPARRLLTVSFTFVGPDQLVGLNPQNPGKSGIVQLPAGQVAQELALPAGQLERASQPRHVLIRPVPGHEIGAFDLQAGKLVGGWNKPAIDLWGEEYVAEHGVGDLGMFVLQGDTLRSTLSMPSSLLAAPRTATMSPDQRWLAISGSTRGAVWDAVRGERMAYVHEFHGSFIDAAGMLYAEQKGEGKLADVTVVMRYDARARQISNGGQVRGGQVDQYGPWLLLQQRLFSGTEIGRAYQIRDVRTPTVPGWTKTFQRDPPYDYWLHAQSDAFALVWRAESNGGRSRIRQDEALKKTVNQGDLQGDFLIELFDIATGELRNRLVIETGKGSFALTGLQVRGDRMFVSDTLGRVLTYSVSSGELTGSAFGDRPMPSADGRALALDTGTGRVVIYDAATMTRRADLRFKHPVAFKTFAADGASFLALTSDQTLHTIGVK